MPPKKDLFLVIIQVIILALYLLELEQLQFGIWNFLGGFFMGIGSVGIFLIGIALVQLNRKLSPFPTPHKTSTLITTGAFKATRYPIYTGLFLVLAGYAIYTGSGYKIIVSIVLLALFYYKSIYEEELLRVKFPQYADYQEEVGRFFPKF